MQFIAASAFGLMASFLPLFIHTELKETLLNATYWTGIFQFVGSITTALSAPFWGYMCDHIGMKKVLFMAIAGNMVAFSGMAISNSVQTVIVFRGLQGCFGAD